MNIRKAYDKAIGAEAEVKEADVNTSEEKAYLKQQHQQWLQHPNTGALLNYLTSREQELKNFAASAADAGQAEELIRRHLLKAKAIAEIITYVRTTSSNNNADGK